MKVNEKVRKIRELNNWSQEDMADKLGMSTNGYAKIERGETRLNIPKLEQIADALGIDLVELLSVNERSVVCLVNENSTHSSNYYGASQEISVELEKLSLQLAHKDELIEQQRREIEVLQTLVKALQNNHG